MRISKSTKTSVNASTDKCSYAYWQEEIMDERLAGLDSDAKYEEYLKWKNNNCNSVKGCNAATATDKALQHIKAAIDILGKSGKRDDLTKDSIANLSVVMFDLRGDK